MEAQRITIRRNGGATRRNQAQRNRKASQRGATRYNDAQRSATRAQRITSSSNGSATRHNDAQRVITRRNGNTRLVALRCARVAPRCASLRRVAPPLRVLVTRCIFVCDFHEGTRDHSLRRAANPQLSHAHIIINSSWLRINSSPRRINSSP